MTVKKLNRLSAQRVAHAPAGWHSDGGGLSLIVKADGRRSWALRCSIDGTARNIGLGSYPSVSLAAARRIAAQHRADIAAGIDPTEAKRRAAVPTFAEAAAAAHRLYEPTWRNADHAAEWLDSLRRHAGPLLAMPADRITRSDVLAVLRPIWHKTPETARRVRQRIRKVLGFVMAEHEHILSNAAGEGIEAQLPRLPKVKQHQRAIAYVDVPAAVATVEASQSTPAAKLALRWLILTGVRSGEARGARWHEIDHETATWTIPGERMKLGTAHRVPLSSQALDVLDSARKLDDGSGLIFPSPLRPGEPLSYQALLKVLRVNGIDSTAHGFRTCLRQWLLERTTATWAVAEACLAHTLGNAVEHAYIRDADLFAERREVMQQWADYCEPTPRERHA